MEPSPLRQTTYAAGLLLSKAYRTLQEAMAVWLTGYDLTVTEWAALGAIMTQPECSPGGIADLLQVSGPMVTKILNKLEARSWVSRTLMEQDQRRFVVELTPAGKTVAQEIEQTVRDHMRKFMSGVPRDQLEAYLSVLYYLADQPVPERPTN